MNKRSIPPKDAGDLGTFAFGQSSMFEKFEQGRTIVLEPRILDQLLVGRFLLHAGTIDLATVGPRRTLNMPGLSATVGEEIEALRAVAGDKAVKLIRHEKDETIDKIVAGWARDFDTTRALGLGFKAETSFDQIIRAHVEDELGGKIGG